MQINVNGCSVSLFYNVIGAVPQCPYNWGVGSAFHLMKIHILYFATQITEKYSTAMCLGLTHPPPFQHQLSPSFRDLNCLCNLWEVKQEDWGNTDVGIYQIKPNPSPVKLLSKLTPGLLYFKLCCSISTRFEVSHSMQQFGITGFFEFSHQPVLHSQGSTCSPHSLCQIHIEYFKWYKSLSVSGWVSQWVSHW